MKIFGRFILGILIIIGFSFIHSYKYCNKYKRPLKDDNQATHKQQEFMNCWGKDVESSKSELLILMDSSDSVLNSGFEKAKKFVDSLLFKIKIAFNATRIAIGVFNTISKIKIDYISNPSYANHKCKFKREFKNIKYTGGFTNLRGSLTDADNIFKELENEDTKRNTVNKAVLLISDGVGNIYNGKYDKTKGRDATAEALELKQSNNIEIYTIGIQDADQDMLKKIASHEDLYMYFNEFQDLSNLAWNIRGDEHPKDYETFQVEDSECSGCDANALCGCNLKSGDYKCVCSRGWYGTGVYEIGKSNCLECKKDTYGDKRYLQGGCRKCPPNSGTKYIKGSPALSIKRCTCNFGYSGYPAFGSPCRPLRCPNAPVIAGATKLNPTNCSLATFNVSCYYKCVGMHRLVGSIDHVTCTAKDGVDKGNWSYPRPECKLPSCVADWVKDADRDRMKVTCNRFMNKTGNSYPAGTTCEMNCKDDFYQSGGKNLLTCTSTGKWDLDYVHCGVATCEKIPKSKNLSVRNPLYNCLEKEIKVKERCEFVCPKGYEIPPGKRRVLECLASQEAKGKWDVNVTKKEDLPSCLDTEKPKFGNSENCQNGIYIDKETLPGKNYTQINFEMINVTDNSGEKISIDCVTDNGPCEYEMGKTYDIYITKSFSVQFEATDAAGNKQLCRFYITVEDKEAPKFTECPENIEITTSDSKSVTWEDPKVEDNCGEYPSCDIKLYSTIKSGAIFTVGTPNVVVRYTATDPSNNVNDSCAFLVHLKKAQCEPLNIPINGLLAKINDFVLPRCRKGFYPDKTMGMLYACINGMWTDTNQGNPGQIPIPDCIKKSPPEGVEDYITMSIDYEGNCKDPATREQIRQNLKKDDLFKTFNVEDAEILCGKGSLLLRRRKRNVKELSIKLSIVSKAESSKFLKDPKAAVRELAIKMNTVITPKLTQNLKAKRNWNSINKNLRSLERIRSGGLPTEKCLKPGEEQNFGERKFTKRCTLCGVGHYKNPKTKKCEKCPKGMYQPLPGQTKCLSCPKNSKIDGNDNKNFTSCKTLCQPGEYSVNGLQPCNLCRPGHYSDKSESRRCQHCPKGTTTLKSGAKSILECGSLCQPGTYSKNGVEPCKACAKGFYQEHTGQGKCEMCPNLLSTSGEGTIRKNSCILINNCESNPCQNGARCLSLKDNYKCQCQEGYWGDNCEKDVNECALRPCMNNGTCLDKFRSYECLCLTGTTGDNCNEVYTKCDSIDCSNHGKCVDLPGHKFKCVCDRAYSGEFCESKIDPCFPNPCVNDGVCLIENDKDFKCVCNKGYSGPRCEKDFNFCSSSPCKNGATCIDQSFGYSCMCTKGYDGTNCGNQINMCRHKKCRNGGVCQSTVGDVICKCAPGYAGPQCDAKMHGNFDFSFQSRVSTSFSSIHGRKDLHQFTLAFYMRTADKDNFGTPISYAVEKDGVVQDNAFVLTDYSNFNLIINNETSPLSISVNDGLWHHIAITWSNLHGKWRFYLDGYFKKRANLPFQQGEIIPKGGLFVIGEEQDGIGSKFTPSESFIGDLSQLHIWDYELDSNEIYDLTMSCKTNEGNVVAWSDFANDIVGRVERTEISKVCQEKGYVQDFQLFRDHALPQELSQVVEIKQSADAYGCLKYCSASLEWCRAVTFNRKFGTCSYHSTTTLIHGGNPVVNYGNDLFLFACLKPLGIADGKIEDNQIIASSKRNGAMPYFGRLYNTITRKMPTPYWQPDDNDKSPKLTIGFKSKMRVFGIATQGNPIDKANEYTSKFSIHSYDASNGKSWLNIGDFKGNDRGSSFVYNNLNAIGTRIGILPSLVTKATRNALRVELYGCPLGESKVNTPRACSYCHNDGKCFKIWKRIKCICREGWTGPQCRIRVKCRIEDLDIPLNANYLDVLDGQIVYFYCKAGFSLSDKYKDSPRISCSDGRWSKQPDFECKDINECSQNICSDHCENLVGSFRCSCPLGKKLLGDGTTCTDVDECESNTHGCQNHCMNTDGGYICLCPGGYFTPQKRMCFDINECNSNQHQCQHICENTLKGYRCKCKVGYRLASDMRSCIHIGCSSLPSFKNGIVKQWPNGVKYECNEGFKMDGEPVRNCQDDGKWSGAEPLCRPIKCTRIGAPDNGQMIRIDGNSYKSVAEFRCLHGYELIGSNIRTCGENSTWSGVHPRCSRRVCPKFNVHNGEVLGLGSIAGSIVRIKCWKGYRLVQKDLQFRECQNNGEWTGGNGAKLACKIISCGQLQKPSGMEVDTKGKVYYNAIATYRCVGKACLEGGSTRRCQANGQWSGSEPICKVNSCCKPYVPQNARLYSNGTHNIGENAYIRCDKGYILGGTDFRKCQSNGQWTGNDTTCRITDCGDPGLIANGKRIVFTKTTYLSKVRYFCKPGYLMKGSDERICQENGAWSGIQPSCTFGKYGGHIRGKFGNITCPNGSLCHFIIEVIEGKKVTIDFAKFDIGDGKVEVYDFESFEPFVTFTKSLRPKPVTSNHHSIRVIANGYVSINFKESNCGGMLSDKFGDINSPNYPNKYPANSDCYWTIHRPYDRLEFKFIDFKLQQRSVDFVTIKEGPFESADLFLHEYYGSSRILPRLNREWADRWYWIHFKTDGNYEFKGFQAIYKLYQPRKSRFW